LEDLAEEGTTRYQKLSSQLQGPFEEERRAGAICRPDAGGGWSQITEHYVEGGGKMLEVGGLQSKDVGLEYLNVGRQFQSHGTEVHAHHETAVANGASTVLEPRARMAPEIQDALAGPKEPDTAVDFLKFVHRASRKPLFLCPLKVVVLRLPSIHGSPARLVVQGSCNIEEKRL
jgi:hypothetical protein